jgi:putative photosynthetic complex assembly protein
MSQHVAPRNHHEIPIPRGVLVAAAIMVVVTTLAAAFVRLTGIGFAHYPDAPAVAQRDLRFVDEPDGTISVLLSPGGERLATIAAGQENFLRGTMRGLARARRAVEIGPEPAFRLVGRADGRLTLEDPSTGRRVDLESFGPDNAAVFARLLETPVPRP